MEYFKQYFNDTEFNGEENKVCCPFHNDTNPSASINTTKDLFYCYTCGKGYSEEQFYSKINNTSIEVAREMVGKMNSNSSLSEWEVSYKARLWANQKMLAKLYSMGFTNDNIEQLSLGMDTYGGYDFLAVPVLYNGALLDIRRYNIYKDNTLPKLIGNKDTETGFIIPYDLWKDNTEPTYIFEGEKDMIMGREQGLNSITLTGGAKSLPNPMMLDDFKDKEVIICYDNDDAGRDGSSALAKELLNVCSSVKILDIGNLVENDKEDFYDYMTLYNGDIFEFISSDLEEIKNEETILPTTKMIVALKENKLRQKISSVVTVASEYSDIYNIPTHFEVTKVNDKGSVNDMYIGEVRTWDAKISKPIELLSLIELDAKQSVITDKLKYFCGINSRECGLSISTQGHKAVYKVAIADIEVEDSTLTLDLYSFQRLIVGEQYRIDYRIVAHPTKNQKLVAFAEKATPLNEIEDFKVDKETLSQFQLNGSVEERLNYLYQSAKHHIAKHLDYNIWLMSDLVFNSALDFFYGENLRGALDVFFLGDTQVGKSETTSKLTELYNFGQFLSLKTSTTVGLIGGSNKVDGSWCTTLGAIPRQHKKLVVLEEFSGASPDFIKTMTDIRSSNEIRIARASGELRGKCKLRMITISNPINDDKGTPRFLATFPNGVAPLMELIKSAEDVARYDGFLLIPRVEKRFNPFEFKLEGTPIPKTSYAYKSQWIYTRQPENIKLDVGVETYIWQQAEKLNEKFECNFPLFGTTTSKKLARFCVALAILIVNTDDTYENVIVTKEIVDYIVKFLTTIYTAPQFRLDKYKSEYEAYNTVSKQDIDLLQALYPSNVVLLDFLSSQSKTSRNNLRAVSGLDGDRFNPIFNKLVLNKFIKIEMDSVYPTNKYRKTYPQLNPNLITVTDELSSVDKDFNLT